MFNKKKKKNNNSIIVIENVMCKIYFPTVLFNLNMIFDRQKLVETICGTAVVGEIKFSSMKYKYMYSSSAQYVKRWQFFLPSLFVVIIIIKLYFVIGL